MVVGIGLAGLLLAGLVTFIPWYDEPPGYANAQVPDQPSPTTEVSP